MVAGFHICQLIEGDWNFADVHFGNAWLVSSDFEAGCRRVEMLAVGCITININTARVGSSDNFLEILACC